MNESAWMVSRRDTLKMLGSAVVGAAAAAGLGCPGSRSPALASSFPVFFGGLNLFVIEPGQLTVAMPRGHGESTHFSLMLLFGGRPSMPGSPEKLGELVYTDSLPFGPRFYAYVLTDRRLEVRGSGNPAVNVHDEPVNYQSRPDGDDAEAWKSMRRVLDVRRVYSGMSPALKADWESALSRSIVRVNTGEVMALPPGRSYNEPATVLGPTNEPIGTEHVTGGVRWNVPFSDSLTLAVYDVRDPKKEAHAPLVITRDTTGPVGVAILHLPQGETTSSHLPAIAEMFDGIDVTSRSIKPPDDLTPPSLEAGIARLLGQRQQAMGFNLSLDVLFRILNDGSILCPNMAFRPTPTNS